MLNEIPVKAASASAQSILSQWRQAIQDGNDAFSIGNYAQAITHYEQALAVSTECFGVIEDAENGVATYVIAHHNLADTYRSLENQVQQRLHLCLPHEKLYAAMNDRSLPESWQLAAQNHSRRTYTELSLYLSQHPEDGDARRIANLGAAGATGSLSAH